MEKKSWLWVVLAAVVLGIGYYLAFSQPGEVEKEISKGDVYVYFVKPGETENEFIPRRRDVGSQLALSDALVATLQQLLAGPTEEEKVEGLITLIPAGTVVQSVREKDGVVTVNFNENIDKGVAGSATVTAIRGQIEKTVMRFPEVKELSLMVDGQRPVSLEP